MKRLIGLGWLLVSLAARADAGLQTRLSRAETLVDRGQPDRALVALSTDTFENIRTLPPRDRARIYDVLVHALEALRKGVAAQTIRLESQDMLMA